MCGGPFGIEPIVRVMGPAVSLVLLCAIPLVWSVQEALMTAELSCALPEMGGFVIWLSRGLGDSAAQQIGYWRVVSAMFDIASYPLLMLSYLTPYADSGSSLPLATHWAVGTAVLLVAGLLNALGVEVVGNASAAFAALVLAPFVVLVFLGFSQISPEALASLPPSGQSRSDWGGALSVLLWNLSYFDLAGTFASEVVDAQASFLPAMLGALALALVAYALPLVVGVSVATDYSRWEEGYFVAVSRQVRRGGPWLAGWLSAAGAVCSFAVLNSIVSTSSRVLVALSQLGVAPKWVGVLHPRLGTPVRATLVNVGCGSALLLCGEWELVITLSMALCTRRRRP